jgi:DNA-binding transcriptional ArsR family regulator
MYYYNRAAEVLKALSHPLRLRILEILQQEGEACVCHLEAHLGQRQAYISQQLARLREAGLVVDRREGMNIYYSLAVSSLDGLFEVADNVASQVELPSGQRAASAAAFVSDPVVCPCPKCAERRGISSYSAIDPQKAV